jgi:large subunit ribosomal protein L21
MYAILSHGGRQYRVSAGDRLLVDRLDAQVGSVVALEPVLLTGGEGKTALGKDVDGLRVAVTVVAHRRGEKLRIFKYKAKKRSRKMAGYRSDLTELRVESILAKGAALPKATAAPEPRSRRQAAEVTADLEAPTRTVGRAPAAAAAAPAPARAPAKTAKTTKAGATTVKPKAPAASATTKPKAPAAASAKAAPKRASKGGTSAKSGGTTAKGKEKVDGA